MMHELGWLTHHWLLLVHVVFRPQPDCIAHLLAALLAILSVADWALTGKLHARVQHALEALTVVHSVMVSTA